VIKGVHQIVAMTFIDEYYDGCHVHHKDENKHNNRIFNLEILSHSDHARLHSDPSRLVNYVKKNGPPNKGKKMSAEFCEKCRVSAIRRAEREKKLGITHAYELQKRIHINQFMNVDGTKRVMDPEKYEKFREACKLGALKRNKKDT
jgi:hypothetical protein